MHRGRRNRFVLGAPCRLHRIGSTTGSPLARSVGLCRLLEDLVLGGDGLADAGTDEPAVQPGATAQELELEAAGAAGALRRDVMAGSGMDPDVQA
jgi:hypothetical protein